MNKNYPNRFLQLCNQVSNRTGKKSFSKEVREEAWELYREERKKKYPKPTPIVSEVNEDSSYDDNLPTGILDPAADPLPFEPDLDQYRDLIWKFIDTKREDLIDFIEDQAGECNKEMILEWIDCDVEENSIL